MRAKPLSYYFPIEQGTSTQCWTHGFIFKIGGFITDSLVWRLYKKDDDYRRYDLYQAKDFYLDFKYAVFCTKPSTQLALLANRHEHFKLNINYTFVYRAASSRSKIVIFFNLADISVVAFFITTWLSRPKHNSTNQYTKYGSVFKTHSLRSWNLNTQQYYFKLHSYLQHKFQISSVFVLV